MTTRYEQAKARIEEWRECFIENQHADMVGAVSEEQIEIHISNHPYKKSLETLKDVLGLHGPDSEGNCSYCTPWRRYEGIVQFPCPTAEKIIEGVLAE